MAAWLEDAGIEYIHLPGLGGRRKPLPDSANGGWREEAFRGYADHMTSAEFQDSLAALEAAGRRAPAAVMCAEAVWWRCHRRLIADALVVRGWRVEHLGVDRTHAVHSLTAFAAIGAGGRLTYPPAQAAMPAP